VPFVHAVVITLRHVRLMLVDAVNTFRLSAGHLASFRVLSRSESRHLRRSDHLPAWFDSRQLH
jgi:hypothetical protein